jgi:hypothetical protein
MECLQFILYPLQMDPSDEGCINSPLMTVGCYQLMENPLKDYRDLMEGNKYLITPAVQ